MKYTLTARLGTATRQIRFEAGNDNEATLDASFKILDLAYRNPIWAKGAIQLHNPEGVLLNEMEAK